MPQKISKHIQKHKAFWRTPTFISSVGMGVMLLIFSFGINYFANGFSASHASNSVNDIILDNIAVYNVSAVFLEGGVLFIIILIAILFLEPKFIPFTIKSIALFIVVRSLFMILTHLAPPAHDLVLSPDNFLERLLAGSGDDLFFSGHTGLPFLMGFIFWDHKFFRWFFFLASAIGGAAALLGHVHYSIDVFSAMFISFGIYHLALHFFSNDYQLSKQ
ncbi:MAG: phosphatase PAP2-related protein [Candidatus Doudnabacteria bacterium]|nr:phosphatase PAP2-related protein [Candidatus Doudnabacteria bacterium]